MKSYYSLMHSTCNENGHEELQLEHHKGLFRSLFKLPTIKETYVSNGMPLQWKNKLTNEPVSMKKYYEIIEIIRYMRLNSEHMI